MKELEELKEPATRYSWIVVPLDPTERPITGRESDPSSFFDVRSWAETFTAERPDFAGVRYGALHILDGYGQVVWTGRPKVDG